MLAQKEGSEPVEINIDPAKIGLIIIMSRAFNAKANPVVTGSNPNETDGGEHEILENCASDPTLIELRGAIDALSEDEVIDLIALAWLGRGDFAPTEWSRARSTARDAQCWHSRSYLIGMPALSDYLETALVELGCKHANIAAERP